MKRNKNIFTLFEEYLDSELLKSLGVKNVNYKDYIFDEVDINKTFYNSLFEIKVLSKISDPLGVIIPVIITYNNIDYDIKIIYNDDEDILFALNKENGINQLKSKLKSSQLDILEETINHIIDEILPLDYWEVKSKLN